MGVDLASPRVLAELVQEHGGELSPREALERAQVRRIAPVHSASEGDLAPLLSRRYLRAAKETQAVLLVDEKLASLIPDKPRWIHPHATFVMAALLREVETESTLDERHLARIEEGAFVHETARIGAFCVIQRGARVGPLCRLEPHVVVYGRVCLGARVWVGASSVLGRAGFGFTASPSGEVVRVPQLGGVVVEDDAEIGPLCTVDAGTLSPTRIGRFAKLDAHVHVGHNAEIGAGSFVAAQSGFAGSSRLGRFALVGGQVGVADHCEIGDGARLAAKAGVIGDVPAGATFAGYPAIEKQRWLRAQAHALEDVGRKNRKGRS